jgi:hypothetical protein
MLGRRTAIVVAVLGMASPALAGPPFVSDDPEPTDYKHFEIYTFNAGTAVRGDLSGSSGIDFNYGAAPDLQLTATIPGAYDLPTGSAASFGLGNVELAAKYRFLHQDSFGLDVSVFPRVFLPSPSKSVGTNTVSLLLPLCGLRRTGRPNFMDRERDKVVLKERLQRCRRLANDFPNGVTAHHIREIEAALEDDIRALEEHQDDFS